MTAPKRQPKAPSRGLFGAWFIQVTIYNIYYIPHFENFFIQTNNIGFKGKKVFLVIDGVVVKSLDISKYKGDKLDNNPFSFKEFNVNNLPQTSNIKAMLTALEKMTYEVSVKCDKIVDRIIMANKENRNRKINTVELKLKKKMNL